MPWLWEWALAMKELQAAGNLHIVSGRRGSVGDR